MSRLEIQNHDEGILTLQRSDCRRGLRRSTDVTFQVGKQALALKGSLIFSGTSVPIAATLRSDLQHTVSLVRPAPEAINLMLIYGK